MSIDRDAWIDAVYNVSKFEADGLPMETRWNSCLGAADAGVWSAGEPGYWLDPRRKEFGGNARYFEHNIPEARKLLDAAGYPDGFDFVSYLPEGPAYGRDFPSQVQIIEGMILEAGFKAKEDPVNYTAEFIPKYRDGRGQHDGVAHKLGAGYAFDAVARLVYELHSKGGTNFYGFSTSSTPLAGDPSLDSLIEKARSENDAASRKSLVHDIQRYMAQKQYHVMWPGGANGFVMAWPVIGNFMVYQGNTIQTPAARWWIDETKPPLNNA
jgi:ABC-type transport system substrate-binding protein